ncbi:methylornithine synthase PylB [Parasporobacterium paucivorans]|uniref:Pyrrolysine biosynthesis protein PylB n=1 Tax=Parasporobacterium paucivorans DSM 15970 TaxID=1122934 RepID=A0A1M6IHM9_9FIRM|nr:methylornithine synthase PylB [Parasporobacterium paucivorans]SHJ33938.1 pyrrolysine biosynthesis protein PylB [Parasporobacterium paucivorans DSM 15970]
MLMKILEKCRKRSRLSKEEIVYLLSRTDKRQTEQIFAAAREARQSEFGNKVFLYGFVYFSTYCKNDCSFCYYRKDNENPPRYRKTLEEVVETAKELRESGIHLIDLTTGDDPYYTGHPKRLAQIVKEVKEATSLPVMVSPGVLDTEGLKLIRDAGADWYALYQETHRKSLFELLRLGQSYEERMFIKAYARDLGMLIEEGLLTGVGDTLDDRAHSFGEMGRLQASQLRTMTFIPQEGAPLEGDENPPFEDELMNIAVMRLLFPDALIPASLDVEGLEGLEKRLMAGANVVTSIIPPRKGYAGVASCEHDIDDGFRTVEGIQETLGRCRMEKATAGEYEKWVADRRKCRKTWSSIKCG